MKSKKRGGSKSKKKIARRKKKFSLEFNFGGELDKTLSQTQQQAKPTQIQKLRQDAKKQQERQAAKSQQKASLLKGLEPIKSVQEDKITQIIEPVTSAKKKQDPIIILLFLMFLVGWIVFGLAFVFRDYFILYLVTSIAILVANLIFFIVHKKGTGKEVKIKQEVKTTETPKEEIKIQKELKQQEALETIASQKSVQIETPHVDIKKEKAKAINLIVTIFSLAVIIYVAVSKGFISRINWPQTIGLNYIVTIVVVIAAFLVFFNARRRSKKRIALIKKATQAVVSGTISPSQIRIPMGATGKIVLEGQEVKLKKYQTEFDLLLEIVNQKKSVGVTEIVRIFSVPKDLVEEWGRILEEHGLIKVYYPALGDPLFRSNTFVEVKKQRVKKTNGTKSN